MEKKIDANLDINLKKEEIMKKIGKFVDSKLNSTEKASLIWGNIDTTKKERSKSLAATKVEK